MTKVKICGITNLEDALLSAKFGADALGFNFYEKSPRCIAPEKAREIIEQLPANVLKVGVFVNESLEKIIETASIAKLDALQLHGEETPEFARELKAKTNLEIIKAFRVSPEFQPEDVLRYETDAILLDAYSPQEYGGTGETFDWEIAKRVQKTFPKMYLAGGLSENNIAEAILFMQPFAVDICSLVEKVKGKKNKIKLRNFFNNSKLNFPEVFKLHKEDSKFISRIKKKTIKNFSWNSSASLQNTSNFAYWLYIFGKEANSLTVCEFLSEFQFTGDFNLWTWIEHSLALQSRLYRKSGKMNESSNCINKILSAGFIENRLDGLFVYDREKRLQESIVEKDNWAVRELTFLLLIELCLLVELGGSPKLSVNILEDKLSKNLKSLREIVKVSL